MSGPKFGAAVLIGRFQPPHAAHLRVMLEALDLAEHLVVVLGSARAPRTPKNPFTDAERATMLRAALRSADVPDDMVSVVGVRDVYYHLPLWVQDVQSAVHSVVGEDAHVALVGFEKDASSFYLRLFPTWSFVPSTPHGTLSATEVRAALMAGKWRALAKRVPYPVLPTIWAFAASTDGQTVEADARAAEKLSENGVRRTAAAVVVAGDRLVLRPRDDAPGAGHLALPERIGWDAHDAARAAAEALGLPAATLLAAHQDARLLNHPDRVPGARWVTQAHLFRLDAPTGNPADWWPLSALDTESERIFADHARGAQALLEGWPTPEGA
ncbi:cytidyltransferase-related domain protein [Deinococcus maricopensis DSM 21211]|uniref:Cytidyltransferase-related domain protein n=1 Tax=Deinococcus maricopensis (strain DSM 21211 / LMG 22137 / NRRL B-23946 / LB-34) TaxID=709986 RepID=E8U9D4_DEIML|nr:cytidyltransferase-related domain protein [Deinococcus maricopensis DSM 21211]